ncbi:TIGR00730 family Rossman fold protein [Phytomonospora sp. NPDC050363]|uniref:LOG family protein n=1 Tax=Phytomonospora sp. NPDC050363 TaxID=3155642 RepID=UPI0033D2361F
MTTLTASTHASPRRPTGTSVAVFCGARPGTPAAAAVARRVGELLGRGGHRLIYGGGGSGLMGELAWSAYEHGAGILGVLPGFLHEKERNIAAPPQTVRLTESMDERKAVMLAEADAFLALPGGYGTVDEILDVISLTYLEQHRKPMALVQVEGEWVGLAEVLDGLVRGGYADPLPGDLFQVMDDPVKAVELVTAPVATVR